MKLKSPGALESLATSLRAGNLSIYQMLIRQELGIIVYLSLLSNESVRCVLHLIDLLMYKHWEFSMNHHNFRIWIAIVSDINKHVRIYILSDAFLISILIIINLRE